MENISGNESTANKRMSDDKLLFNNEYLTSMVLAIKLIY